MVASKRKPLLRGESLQGMMQSGRQGGLTATSRGRISARFPRPSSVLGLRTSLEHHRCRCRTSHVASHSRYCMHLWVSLWREAVCCFSVLNAKFLGVRQALCKQLSVKLAFNHGNPEVKLNPIHWRLLGNGRKIIKILAQPQTERVAQKYPASHCTDT